MLAVCLKKLSSNKNKLRTDEVTGKCTHAPEIGSSFIMFSEPLDKTKTMRRIQTSTIVELVYYKEQNSFEFKTLNSLYELKVLDGKDPEEYKNWKKLN